MARWPGSLVGFALMASALSGAYADIPIVSGFQKISAEAGGFGGLLETEDWFGASVARLDDLNDDGVDDLAVGAMFDNDGDTDNGAVWILLMNSGGTVENQQLISSTDGYGLSMSSRRCPSSHLRWARV